MAAQQPGAKDPLDALQLLVNDVLVQTGKALRASRKDGHGNVPAAHGSLQARLPDTIKAFHSALDDLESDIIRAKSVLLRDLNELQSHKAQKAPSEQLQPQQPPMELQTISPPTIDLDSSPSMAPRDHAIKTESVIKPVAPFPDMGMSLPDAAQPSMAIKDENTPTHLSSVVAGGAEVKVEGGASAGPMGMVPAMDRKPAGDEHHAPDGDDALNMNNPRLNFTDMEFTLAPANDESQDHAGGEATDLNTGEASFDLASFAPSSGADGSGNNNNNNNMASLDSVLPANLAGGAPANAPNSGGGGGGHGSKPGDARGGEAPDSAFADIFTGDGQADGMDFDFSIGDGGMGGDTFDDLMNDRDNTFGAIEHGDFDATFFGLDKADGA